MIRRILLCMVCVLMLSSTAYSYDIKVLSDIPLGGNVSSIGVDPSGTAAVVCESNDMLYVVNTKTGDIVANAQLEGVPSALAVDGKDGVAALSGLDGYVSVYSLTNCELIQRFNAGAPVYSVSADNTGSMLLLGVDGGVMRMDLAGALSPVISIPGKAVKVLAEGNNAVVVSESGGGTMLHSVDLDSGIVPNGVPLPGVVSSIEKDPGLGVLLITLVNRPNLFLYDSASLSQVGEILTGRHSEVIAVNPSTHIAVLSDTADGSLTVVDIDARTVVATVPLYEDMGPVAVDPLRGLALVGHDTRLAVLHIENPVPAISRLIPEESDAGSPGFPLSVEGSRFVDESQTWFNEKMLDTTAESTEGLKARVPSEELLEPGEVTVAVTNPTPGGGMSNELKFKILTPAPKITSLVPDSVAAGSQGVTLRVEGSNFLPCSYINIDGAKVDAKFVSSTVLEAMLDDALLAGPASHQVSVTNNGPNVFTSAAMSLEVTEEEPPDNPPAAPAGAGSLTGLILDTQKRPIPRVTIRTHGRSAVTGSNGYFRLDGIPAGRRTVILDGASASSPEAHYPTIPVTVDIVANAINELPFQPYFHRQKNRNFVNIDPASDTVLTDPEVPGFEMRIPAGVNIRGWDGVRNARISVRTVPADRLPVKPLPKGAHLRTVYMFYFDKVGGGVPDAPIPVRYPNNLGLLPGEKAILWYFDESPNEGDAPNDWAIAGTCTVTSDGKYIVSDPGVGIPKFCCGASGPGTPGYPNPGTSPDDCQAKQGDPVDITNGNYLYEHTDMVIPGIIPVRIKRYYRSYESSVASAGPAGLAMFGMGTGFEYDWGFSIYGDSDELIRVIKPGYYKYDFNLNGGVYTNTKDPGMRGAKITVSGGEYTLTMRDGWKYRFGNKKQIPGTSPADYFCELLSIEDRNGNALTFERRHNNPDEGGYMTKITTAEGNEITLTQTFISSPVHFWRTDSITDYTGRQVRYEYEYPPYNASYPAFDDYPRLNKVIYPDGGEIAYAYDSLGRLSTVTNQNGVVELTNEYNTDHRVTRQTHSDGSVWTFDYTVAGGFVTETTMTEPNGAQKTWRFNSDGYITDKTTADGTTYYDKQTGTNELNSVTDALGRQTTYTYYSTTDAKNGLVHTMTDNLGHVTTYDYETTYGFVTSIIDALNNQTTFSYTFDGSKLRQTQITDPLSHATVINYNGFGGYSSITDANNNTAVFGYYTSMPGLLRSVSDALGNTAGYAYDALGRLATVTDARGVTTTYGYNVMDRVTSVKDAAGNVTRYSYDPRGNLLKVTDAKQGEIRYDYDDRDRVTKMTDQLGRVETYEYYRGFEIMSTTGPSLKSVTDRNGQVTTFDEYDHDGRLKKVTYDDGSYTTYDYDLAGRVTDIYDSVSGAISYTYNDFGCGSCNGSAMDRIASETTPQGVVNYTYDAVGRRVSMTLSGSPVVNYTYDAAGRLTQVSRNIGGTTRNFELAYDDAGRRTLLQVGLYKSKGKWKYLKTTYGYDIANELTGMLIADPAGTTIDSLSYSYDPNGNRTYMTKSATVPMASSMSGTDYDEANEMTQHEGYDLTYDDNGNLLTKTDASGTTYYTWDARNRLTDISGPSMTASFDYDALGRRTSKSINGTTTDFVYDGWDIIQDTTGSVTTDYTRTLNIDEPLALERSDGTVRYYVQDALGSVVVLTDDQGLVTSTYQYDAFGNTTINGSDYNPFQYTGRENDGTGLYYYRARYYSPEMRRFVSEDPIGLKSAINYYEYVKNNPQRWKDSTGLVPMEVDLGVKSCPAGMKRVISDQRFRYSSLNDDFLDMIGKLLDAASLLRDASFNVPLPYNKKWQYESLLRYWICVPECYEKEHTSNHYNYGTYAIWDIVDVWYHFDYGPTDDCCKNQ